MSLGYKLNRIFNVFFNSQVEIVPLPDDIETELDMAIPMRDGQTLYANLYRPSASTGHQNDARPVIMCFHPYSKDNVPKAGWIYNSLPWQYRMMRMTSRVTMSEGCSWEAPDPLFWVKNGFNVINMDKRGFFKSAGAGKSTIFDDQEAEDYYDAIEWVAKQPWSNGKVGLCGVSYLAISQYKVAALNPPHLTAICPWEGLSDTYKDLIRPGGVHEIGFTSMWFKGVNANCNEDLFGLSTTKETRNDPFYLGKVPDLKAIKAPALICMSYSDQGLHTSGSFRAFRQISSPQKWLWTHRDGKWSAFYSEEAKAMQLKFFNHFLKGEDNGMLDVPRVRIEIRDRADHVHSVRTYKDPVYPLKEVKWQTLQLRGDGTIALAEGGDEPAPKSVVPFKLLSNRASFCYKFDKDSIINGPMKATLIVSSANATDMNLFLFARKLDSHGCEVLFEGPAGFGEDVVAKGWLRIALRKLFTTYAEPWDCDKPFDEMTPLQPNVPEVVTVQLLPSSTFFEKGSSLVLEVHGKTIFPWFPLVNIFNYEASKTDAEVEIHCGKVDDIEECSNLLVGFLPEN